MFATLLAKETDGRPVKVTWTREEDTRHDVYRPAALGRFRARLGDDGMPVAVEMKIASPSVIASTLQTRVPVALAARARQADRRGRLRPALHDPELPRRSAHQAEIGIPVGSWRSVGASFNGFFHECFLDEVAAAGKVDPVEMRRKLMADYPGRAGGGRTRSPTWRNGARRCRPGKAKGFAFTLSFGSWVGEIVAGRRHAGRHPHREGVDRRRRRHRDRSRHHRGAALLAAPSTACRRRWARRSPSPTAWPSSRTSTTSTPCASTNARISRSRCWRTTTDGRRRRSRHAAGGCSARQCGLGADRQARALAADLEAGGLRMRLPAKLPDICRHSGGDGRRRPRRRRPAMRPADLRNGTRSTRSSRIRAAPTAMSRTTGRAGRARITASPACMASMSSAAPTAAASAIRACAARPAISPAIPACCMAARRRGLASGAGRDGVVGEIVGRDLRADQGSERNGGRTLEEVAVHVRDDRSSAGDGIPAPAASRLPARPSRPIEAIEEWAAAGAPCPPTADAAHEFF